MDTYVWINCKHCDGKGKHRVFNHWVLRQRRQFVGLSLRAVARAIGFTAPYLSDVEWGRRQATPKIIKAYELKSLRKMNL